MKRGGVDRPLLIALLILAGFGVLMVFSASMYTSSVDGNSSGLSLFAKQLFFVALGLVIMYFISRIDYRRLNNKDLSYFLMGASGVLLVAVLLIGVEVNDAKRWISLGFTTFQPSELAKVSGIIYLAGLICREPKVLRDSKQFAFRCIAPIMVLCGLTAIEPSLSAAIAIGVGMLIVLFLGGVNMKRFLPYVLVMLAGVVILLIAEPWRLERIRVMFGQGTVDYQITQSLLAIGTGGIFGKGLGNGMQKYLFLPELQNDFIFANIGEEFGLLGCLFVIGLFCFIIIRGIKIANCSPDRFGYLYTSSVMILLGFQVVVNIGVATKVLPVTGMALPFVSAGGSSMLVLFAMMGPIFNLSRRVNLEKRKKHL